MGTASPTSGPAGSTPLVPTWLDDQTAPSALPVVDGPDSAAPTSSEPPQPTIEQAGSPSPVPDRFRSPRSNFSRFAKSGGRDRASLGRALSTYVRDSSGGARTAARRMRPAAAAGARLLGFLTDTAAHGSTEALRRFNLQTLAGQPIAVVFASMVDFICGDGGATDEAIARDAFIETAAALAEIGVTDLDLLTLEQVAAAFECFVAHTIEDRILNDIGTRAIQLPASNGMVERIQQQLRDFLAGAVHDAIVQIVPDLANLDPRQVGASVQQIYEASFELIVTLAETLR